MYMDTFLNKLLCGLRKAHSTQPALFKLLQRRQKEIDNSGLVGTILTDLLKAYGCRSHDLIIAKFEAYGLSKSTISFIIFCDFSMFYQIFLSPEVKRWAIITYKHGIYE